MPDIPVEVWAALVQNVPVLILAVVGAALIDRRLGKLEGGIELRDNRNFQLLVTAFEKSDPHINFDPEQEPSEPRGPDITKPIPGKARKHR